VKVGKQRAGHAELKAGLKSYLGTSEEISGGDSSLADGLVAVTGQQSIDGNILVQRLPMNTAAADAQLRSLLIIGVQKPGKPR